MEKTVLITGCSSGFGRELCNEFKDCGYYVIATARNVMKLSDVKAVLPVMRKHGGGRIYNIGSISGRMTGIANGGYCSSKYVIEAITEAARYETKDMGIEICVIEPGAMDTDFFGTLARNSDEKMKDPDSCYRKIYERDLNFRSRQAKSDVQICAKRLLQINEDKKLKVRYTIGVSWIYRVFTIMPDGLKEWAVRRFN